MPAVDVLLVSALAGAAAALGLNSWSELAVSYLRVAAAACLLLLSVVVARLSFSPAAWVRMKHVDHNVVSGTSLRHTRKIGKNLPCPYPDVRAHPAHLPTHPPTSHHPAAALES